MTTTWLIPLALFWPLAALYLGGARIRIEGGGGVHQLSGLLLSFLLFLGIWLGARVLMSAVASGVVLTLILPALLVVVLLPRMTRVAFRLVGVRIRPDEGPADATA
ncbi:MAG: hypothetical protein RQ745_12620 [Longimicrobiales bacterium]|nr:hypothetical protein [Longimicrobiales bacterium]